MEEPPQPNPTTPATPAQPDRASCPSPIRPCPPPQPNPTMPIPHRPAFMAAMVFATPFPKMRPTLYPGNSRPHDAPEPQRQRMPPPMPMPMPPRLLPGATRLLPGATRCWRPRPPPPAPREDDAGAATEPPGTAVQQLGEPEPQRVSPMPAGRDTCGSQSWDPCFL